MTGNNTLRNQSGFSLMELVTVMAVLLVCGSIIATIYIQTFRGQYQTSVRQEMVNDVRAALETISQNIHTADIDYTYYDNRFGLPQAIPAPTDALALQFNDGGRVAYHLLENQLVAERNGQAFALTNPTTARVVSFEVFIHPATSPFREELCNEHIDCSPTSQVLGGCTETTSVVPVGLCACDNDNDCQVSYRCQTADAPQGVPGVCVPPDQQPEVTLVVGVQAIDPRGQNEKVVFFQTTVSSRIYKR